jgi:hypothetical protein
MVITAVSRVDSYLCTHLSQLASPVARFTSSRGDRRRNEVAGDQQKTGGDRDPTGSREHRVHVLKDLVAERGYDVPAEDVAASIIRDAIVVVSPAPRH